MQQGADKRAAGELEGARPASNTINRRPKVLIYQRLLEQSSILIISKCSADAACQKKSSQDFFDKLHTPCGSPQGVWCCVWGDLRGAPSRGATHTTQNRSPSCSEGGPVQLSRAHCAHHFTTSKVRVTLNRSPSTVSSIVPFCSCARLCAMFSPRPLPSVLRELSPRTKRSISSSLEMFS